MTPTVHRVKEGRYAAEGGGVKRHGSTAENATACWEMAYLIHTGKKRDRDRLAQRCEQAAWPKVPARTMPEFRPWVMPVELLRAAQRAKFQTPLLNISTSVRAFADSGKATVR